MFCLRLPAVSVCVIATSLMTSWGRLQAEGTPARTGTFIRPGGLSAKATLRSPDDVADAAVPVQEPAPRVVASRPAPKLKKYAPPVLSPLLRARAEREAAERAARLAQRKTATPGLLFRTNYDLHSTTKAESSARGQADHGISIAGAWRGQPRALMQPLRLKPAAVLTKSAAYLTDDEPISHDVPARPNESMPVPVTNVAPAEVMLLPETGNSGEIIDWGTPPPEESPLVESDEHMLEDSPDPFADE